MITTGKHTFGKGKNATTRGGCFAALIGAAMACAMLFAGCGTSAATTTAATTADSETTAAVETSAAIENTTEGESTTDSATEGTAAEGTGAQTTADAKDAEQGKAAILVVSFGTSYENRELSIGAIENAINGIDGFETRRAFTSQIIIDKLKKRDNLEIDNVTEALDRAVSDGITTLVVQPTHLMDGYEYNDLKKELEGYLDKFDKVALGAPLLTTDEDFQAVAKAIVKNTKSYDDGETAIVFMGHGTEAASNGIYARMQSVLEEIGEKNYYVGTVEATPSVEDVIAKVKENGAYKKVVLLPLMVVAGDHATNDMAGDEEDSWKSLFEAQGYEVTCILEGLGQNKDIQSIYLAHAQAAVEMTRTGE